MVMPQFTELNEKEIHKIATAYDLEVVDYEAIKLGAGNSNYLLRTKQSKYVLTIFEITWDRVANLVKLLLFLEECEFSTTRLLNPVEGGLTTIFQGKPVLVKPYIIGQVVRDLDNAMLNQIGSAMAGLHDIPAPDYLPDKYSCGLETFPNVIGHNINPEYETWLAQKHIYLRQNIPTELQRGLIHADLFYDNVLFEGKELKAIIDFEDACQYYKVFDLGMGIVGSCTEGSRIDLNKARSLVMGYQQVKVLEKQEMENLQLFVEYAAIATSSYRFWKFNIDTPIAEKADCHWEMVSIAKGVNAIPKAKFFDAIFN